ncbi:MAG: undecaprenyl-diphosphate phosphatase [Oligoflexia bacterium]|nr:undecaprenyl-diphosphate phosphatase [Oligoflexia bacterium]
MAEWLLVCLLGIVEGLTEFLPVSSTGHLILFGDLFGFTGEKAASFDIFIQLGAILAVVVLYRQRFLALLNFSKSDAPFSGLVGLVKIGCGTLPVLCAGFLLHDYLKRAVFNSSSVAVALIAGGAAMLWVEARKHSLSTTTLESLSYRQCLVIGACQCLSLWSGISRSGSTIVGALLIGVERRVAAEYSFLVAVPVMCAATGYDFLKSLHSLSVSDLGMFALGFVVAFLSALVAVRVFVALLQSWTLRPFAYYRIVLGVVVLSLL